MGFFQKKVIDYRCECDYCDVKAEAHVTSFLGDEWDNKKWEKLRHALHALGWASKKTGVAGHSRRPTYLWACPDCAAKDPKLLRSRRRRERNEERVAAVENILFAAGYSFRKYVYSTYGRFEQHTGRRKLFVMDDVLTNGAYSVTVGPITTLFFHDQPYVTQPLRLKSVNLKRIKEFSQVLKRKAANKKKAKEGRTREAANT